MLAALNRFFANELGIDAIVSRPWLTCVAMAVLLAPPPQVFVPSSLMLLRGPVLPVRPAFVVHPGRFLSGGQPNNAGMGSIGAMRKAADELDEIVAGAMTRRREEPRRVNPARGNGWRCVSDQGRKSLSSRETTSPASCIDVRVLSTSSLTFGLVVLKPNTLDTITGNSSRRRPICSLMK
jgi:hypothetical protein